MSSRGAGTGGNVKAGKRGDVPKHAKSANSAAPKVRDDAPKDAPNSAHAMHGGVRTNVGPGVGGHGVSGKHYHASHAAGAAGGEPNTAAAGEREVCASHASRDRDTAAHRAQAGWS